MLDSLVALTDFLVGEARIIEGRAGAQSTHSEAARKEAKDAVPIDKVKDAPALARELRWRVRNARGVSSGDEGTGGSKRGKSMSAPKENGVKRKRDSADVGERDEAEDGRRIFRNWRRKGWEREEFLPKKCEKRVERRARPPAVITALGTWVRDSMDADDEMDQDQGKRPDDEAVVETMTEVVIKVRRKYDAKQEMLERQRVERKVEVYKWPEKDGDIVGGSQVTESMSAGMDEEQPSVAPDKQVNSAGDGVAGIDRKGTEGIKAEGDSAGKDGDNGVEKEMDTDDGVIGQAKIEDATVMVVDVQA